MKVNAKIEQKLYELSQKSNMRFKLGAVVMCGQKIIGTGFNYYFPNIMNEGMLSVHAERLAITRAMSYPEISKLPGSILIVCRFNKSGGKMKSKPCKDCEKFAKNQRIKIIYYDMEWRMI